MHHSWTPLGTPFAGTDGIVAVTNNISRLSAMLLPGGSAGSAIRSRGNAIQSFCPNNFRKTQVAGGRNGGEPDI